MLFDMIRLTLVVLNEKTAFFIMNLVKINSWNHSFTKMWMKIWYTCNLCVIWKYHPYDMYIHLHTIGLIGVTVLGTVTCHLAPNRRRFHWSISQWILLHRKIIFCKSLKFICADFQIFAIFWKHEITVLAKISPEIGPWPGMTAISKT